MGRGCESQDAKACQNLNAQANLLHWPSPLAETGYGLMDYPRFYTPPWGASPVPSGTTIDPALVQTNGYDFRNNVEGDTYIFLLGSTLDEYHGSRAEFIKLAGPCPVLPDFVRSHHLVFVSIPFESDLFAAVPFGIARSRGVPPNMIFRRRLARGSHGGTAVSQQPTLLVTLYVAWCSQPALSSSGI